MDTGFHHEHALGSALKRHSISFQSSAMDSTSEMIMLGNYNSYINSTAGMMFSGNHSMVNNSGISQAGSSCGSLLDSVPGPKHDAGLAVEWSVEEKYKLDEGLVKYADEPSILRYIKIAATLHDKTVRNVALRCRWMTSKRRKQEDLNLGKKLKDKKDNLVDSPSKPSISSASPSNLAAYSLSMNHHAQIDGRPSEALSGRTRRLLEQNNQVLGCISANISSLKLQDNIDLFCHMKNNLAAILHDVRFLPGPPLPESINEDLANSILSNASQATVLGSIIGIHHMKQEPGY